MPVWIVVGVCVVVFVAAVCAAGAFNLFQAPVDGEEQTPSPARSRLPREFTAEDLDRLEFTPAMRGYRMDEVDAVIDALSARLARYENDADAASGRTQAEERRDPECRSTGEETRARAADGRTSARSRRTWAQAPSSDPLDSAF